MNNFKFTRRQATTAEIQSIGFSVEGNQARSDKSGAWYDVENFFVANSATVEGVQQFGQFLYLDDDMPAAERVMVKLDA